MARLSVSLPEDLNDWARSRARQGRYDDPSEYVRDLVRRDRDEGARLATLVAAVDEGLASLDVDTAIEDIIGERESGRVAE